MLLKPSKYFILQELKKQFADSIEPISILELGAGKADIIARLLPDFPNINYTGIEPDPKTSAYAKEHLSTFANARIINKLAYGSQNPITEDSKFDLVISLSVLEHVKDLNSFFDFASQHTKSGGYNIHLYDLGHSLHPSSIKERIQVALCNSFFRQYIPEHKIASYVSLDDVKGKLQNRGFAVEKVTYHNNPCNVSLLKLTDDIDQLQTIAPQEPAFAEKLPDGVLKEKLYPSVCVWAVKNWIT